MVDKQNVMHTAIHIIPRYRGDAEGGKSGIRCVIPKITGKLNDSFFVNQYYNLSKSIQQDMKLAYKILKLILLSNFS